MVQGTQGNGVGHSWDDTVSRVIGGAKIAILTLKVAGEATSIGPIKAVAEVLLEIVNTVEVSA